MVQLPLKSRAHVFYDTFSLDDLCSLQGRLRINEVAVYHINCKAMFSTNAKGNGAKSYLYLGFDLRLIGQVPYMVDMLFKDK